MTDRLPLANSNQEVSILTDPHEGPQACVSTHTSDTDREVPGRDGPGHLGGNLDRWCNVPVLCPPVAAVARAQEGRHTGEEACEANFPLWEAPVVLRTFPLRKANQKPSNRFCEWAPGDLWFGLKIPYLLTLEAHNCNLILVGQNGTGSSCRL